MPDALHVQTPGVGGCLVCGATRSEHGFVDFGVNSPIVERLIPQHVNFRLLCDDCLMDAVRKSPRFRRVLDHYAELKKTVEKTEAELALAREETSRFAEVIDLAAERAKRKGKLPEAS